MRKQTTQFKNKQKMGTDISPKMYRRKVKFSLAPQASIRNAFLKYSCTPAPPLCLLHRNGVSYLNDEFDRKKCKDS